MPALTTEEKLRLLTILLESRHSDLREQNLNRQGKGHFHVSGMGHEALAAVSIQMQEDDYIVPFYRDRALVVESLRGSWPSIISQKPKVKVTGGKCRRITAAPKNTSGACQLQRVHNFCRPAG
jgi:hypothetical protein